MSVIVEMAIPPEAFELGRILSVEDSPPISLETMVPLGGRTAPFFRLFSEPRDDFEAAVEAHPSVDEVHVVNVHDGETLYALDWHIERDTFFQGMQASDATLLGATGTERAWEFELRFPTHEALSGFQEYCTDAGIDIDVERIYNPTRPDSGPWYGLTEPQRETLVRAVETGYYRVPRAASTQDLASEFDISDQAVTERLRRAIDTLATNTLMVLSEDTRTGVQRGDSMADDSSRWDS